MKAASMIAERLPSKDSVASLDPLRALCAISVIAWHLSDHLPFRLPVFASAAFAVDIFMNISGFLMMYHYFLREASEPWGSKRTTLFFYIRRFFRIAPLYYLLLLTLFFWRRPGQWEWLVNRLFFAFGFSPHHATNCIMPDWSIALEMQFYAVFPALALLIRRIGFGAFFCIMSAIAAIANLLISYYSTSAPGLLGNFPQPTLLPLKIHIFAVGMVFAGYVFKGKDALRSLWYIPGILLFATTCQYNYTKLLASIYLSFYVCFSNDATRRYVGQLLNSVNLWLSNQKWLCAPAEFTYSAYLIHNIVLLLFLDRTLSILKTNGATWVGYSQVFIAVLLMVGAISALLLVAVEKPGIRMGKWLISNIKSHRFGPSGVRHGIPAPKSTASEDHQRL